MDYIPVVQLSTLKYNVHHDINTTYTVSYTQAWTNDCYINFYYFTYCKVVPNLPFFVFYHFLYRDWLPRHFDTVKLINAWRVGRKLGRQLIAFNTDSADTGFAAGSEDLPDVSHTDIAGTAIGPGTGTTGTTSTGTLDVIAATGSAPPPPIYVIYREFCWKVIYC
eukprot:SAG11_NODE_521_length_8777_cov_17.940770_8_plen_165_part_00